MITPKMKPCPFCGGRELRIARPDPASAAVWCRTPDLRGLWAGKADSGRRADGMELSSEAIISRSGVSVD